MTQADTAMYEAKQAGRGRYNVYSEVDVRAVPATNHAALASGTRPALAENYGGPHQSL